MLPVLLSSGRREVFVVSSAFMRCASSFINRTASQKNTDYYHCYTEKKSTRRQLIAPLYLFPLGFLNVLLGFLHDIHLFSLFNILAQYQNNTIK